MEAILWLFRMVDDKWTWELYFGNTRQTYVVSPEHGYKTIRSATRAARAMAKTLGLTITKTVEC